MALLAASSNILVSHAKKRELLPDEGCGVLFLSRTFARHRRGARVTDKNRGSCAHKLRVVTHAQLSHIITTRSVAFYLPPDPINIYRFRQSEFAHFWLGYNTVNRNWHGNWLYELRRGRTGIVYCKS